MVTGLLMVVVGSVMGMYQTMQRSSVRQQARSEALDHLRVAMERMTKDIRQAVDIRDASGPSYLEMDTYVNGVEQRVEYDATSGTELVWRTPGTELTLLTQLSSSSIFTYAPDVGTATVVTITLGVRPERFLGDTDVIDLVSEVQLRNVE